MSNYTDTKIDGYPACAVRRTDNETGESQIVMSESAYFDDIEDTMLSKRLMTTLKPVGKEAVSSPAWLVALAAGADGKVRERVLVREKDNTLGRVYSLFALEWFELADSPGKRYVVSKPIETAFEKEGKVYTARQLYDGVAADCDIVEKTEEETIEENSK